MSTIPFTLSQVAQVAVQAVDASATVSAASTGSESIFAGVVISEYGQPFEILHVTKSNWKTLLGKPYHPTVGSVVSEPLRHLADAVEGGEGYVVRVVAGEAKYPVLYVHNQEQVQGVNTAALIPMFGSLLFGNAPELSTDMLFALYPKDGNVSGRSIAMTPIASKPGSFTLTVTDTDKLGIEFTVESLEVSFNLDATDDMGVSTYIENRLHNSSDVLAVKVNPDADFTNFPGMVKTAFTGGTLGNQKAISTAQYDKAIAVLRNALVGYTAVLGLGCYDKVALASLCTLASARRIDAFMDVTPTLSYKAALQFMTDMNLNTGDVAWYHFPYSAKDPHSGGRAVWGLSGIAFQAKAAGVAKSTGAVGGWHYSPAGEERGVINRREVEPLSGTGEPDEKAMYTARINKLGLTSTGKLMIDDAITCRATEDYLRFQHVSSVMNAISRQFYSIASQLKHSPDGITESGLKKGMTGVLDNFVTSQALVTPRNPTEDGESPYVLTVKQAAIDSWEVQWACCVTGTARRILGTPSLIR